MLNTEKPPLNGSPTESRGYDRVRKMLHEKERQAAAEARRAAEEAAECEICTPVITMEKLKSIGCLPLLDTVSLPETAGPTTERDPEEPSLPGA